MSAPPSPSPSRIRFLAAGLCAGLLILAAYSNHYQNTFHFDDGHVIVDNLAIRSLGNSLEFFGDAETLTAYPANAAYRPLLALSYALDYWRAGGLDPVVFHQTQIAFLCLVWLVLVAIFRRLLDHQAPNPANRIIALFAATLFCVHTANTQTVNYFSARSSLLATLGVCTSFLLYLSSARARRYQVHLIPMILGAFVKPIAVMYGPLLFAYLLIFESVPPGSSAHVFGRHLAANIRRSLRGALPALVVGCLMFILIRSMDSESLLYSNVSWLDYARTQPFVWLHYFRLFLLPIGLTADTDWAFVTSWHDTRLFAGALFILALAVLCVLASNRREFRPVGFGIAWFAIALLPTSSVVSLSEPYNEHRIFLPYVGLMLVVACLLARMLFAREGAGFARRAAVIVGCAIVLLAHAAGTHARNEVWRSDATLWKDVAEKSPRNGRGLMNHGLALMRDGDLEGALARFERAGQFVTDYPVLEINLGVVKSALHRDGEGELHFLRALALSPDYAEGRYFFARWLVDHQRGEEAIAHLERSLEISPTLIPSRRLLMRLYAATRSRDDVIRFAESTLSHSPDEPDFLAWASGGTPFDVRTGRVEDYEEIGQTEIARKRWLDAAIVYAQIVKIDPNSARGWNNLGWARFELGFDRLALQCFRRALEIDPALEVAKNNLDLLEKRQDG
jgi:tetratricopeptide (TPR) repeat protein